MLRERRLNLENLKTKTKANPFSAVALGGEGSAQAEAVHAPEMARLSHCLRRLRDASQPGRKAPVPDPFPGASTTRGKL